MWRCGLPQLSMSKSPSLSLPFLAAPTDNVPSSQENRRSAVFLILPIVSTECEIVVNGDGLVSVLAGIEAAIEARSASPRTNTLDPDRELSEAGAA
jgi:hypothetical protein